MLTIKKKNWRLRKHTPLNYLGTIFNTFFHVSLPKICSLHWYNGMIEDSSLNEQLRTPKLNKPSHSVFKRFFSLKERPAAAMLEHNCSYCVNAVINKKNVASPAAFCFFSFFNSKTGTLSLSSQVPPFNALTRKTRRVSSCSLNKAGLISSE